MNSDYDLIIVGAGPAGLSTALHLAQIAPALIPRTLILEKSRHPRVKLCAGGLLPDGEHLLRRLGLDVTTLPHIDVPAARLVWQGRGLRARPLRGKTPLFRVIRRDQFDAWLAAQVRQKGFAILEDTAVRQVRPAAAGMEVVTAQDVFTAKVVVGADGSTGVTRRAVQRTDGHQPVARLLETIAVPTAPRRSRPAEAWFEFAPIAEGISGYLWDFPSLMASTEARCFGIYDANLRPPKRASLPQLLNAALTEQGIQPKEAVAKGHPIRLATGKEPLSRPGLILVGDAAGADALLGEGISFALGYGWLAAQALAEAFAQEDFSFSEYAQTVRRSALGRALKRRYAYANLIYRLSPWQQKMLWQRNGWLVKLLGFLGAVGWAQRLRP